MRSMFSRTAALSVILAAVFAAPASAEVKLSEPLHECYVVAQEDQREGVVLKATGFTPQSTVEAYIDGILQYSGKALADGSIDGLVRAPFHEEGTRPFQLHLAEVNNPANVLTQSAMVTRLAVTQTPRSASTKQRVRFKGRGFMDFTKPVYAHYVFAGKARKSVRLRVPNGPCGTFNVRRKQFPFKKTPRIGTWTIQFDQNPYYDPQADVRVPMTIKVRKTPKRG